MLLYQHIKLELIVFLHEIELKRMLSAELVKDVNMIDVLHNFEIQLKRWLKKYNLIMVEINSMNL